MLSALAASSSVDPCIRSIWATNVQEHESTRPAWSPGQIRFQCQLFWPEHTLDYARVHANISHGRMRRGLAQIAVRRAHAESAWRTCPHTPHTLLTASLVLASLISQPSRSCLLSMGYHPYRPCAHAINHTRRLRYALRHGSLAQPYPHARPEDRGPVLLPSPLSHAVHSLPSKQFPIPVIGMHLKSCAIARLLTGRGRTVRQQRKRLPTDR